MNDERQNELQNKKAGDKNDRLLVSPHPNEGQRAERDHNEQPAQWERDLFVHVIGAGHEGVRVKQKLIVAEINPDGKAEQQNDGDNADEAGARSSWQQQRTWPNRESSARPVIESTVAKFFSQLPASRRRPKNQGAKNRQHKHK